MQWHTMTRKLWPAVADRWTHSARRAGYPSAQQRCSRDCNTARDDRRGSRLGAQRSQRTCACTTSIPSVENELQKTFVSVRASSTALDSQRHSTSQKNCTNAQKCCINTHACTRGTYGSETSKNVTPQTRKLQRVCTSTRDYLGASGKRVMLCAKVEKSLASIARISNAASDSTRSASYLNTQELFLRRIGGRNCEITAVRCDQEKFKFSHGFRNLGVFCTLISAYNSTKTHKCSI
jgi:hypothetical protein